MKCRRKGVVLLILILIFNLLFANFNFVYAQENKTEINLQIGNPIMTVNNVSTEIDLGRGTVPVIVNDRTLVPIRAIIESFGGEVGWDDTTQTVTLKMNSNTIELVIDSKTAYLNGSANTLDVAPTTINDRTMLPIRFVAESFNLNVGWNQITQTVTVSNYNISIDTEKDFQYSKIPQYSGSPYVAVNDNIPYFTQTDYRTVSFENYSELDGLGRCGVALANIGQDIMPTEERGEIGSVKPSGWHTVKYDNVDGKYLYNRCHLIGFQLSGENANKKNLITGTRYMNVDGMLPFENMIDDYVDETNNHVLYRVTPIYEGNNLLANGVLMEAYSIEDNGDGICFNVFCYNVQPGVTINYATGESWLSEDYTADNSDGAQSEDATLSYVGNKNTMRLHYPDCKSVNQMNAANRVYLECSLDEAVAQGYIPCGNCKP